MSAEELLISSSVGKGESGKEVGVCVVFATTVYEVESVCREGFHSAFIAWFRFTDLACVMKALTRGLCRHVEVQPQSTKSPDHATSLKFHRCPTALVVQTGMADRDNGAGRAAGLLFFNGGSKGIGISRNVT